MFERNVFVFSVETDLASRPGANPKSGTHVSRGGVPPVSDGLFRGPGLQADAAKIGGTPPLETCFSKRVQKTGSDTLIGTFW